MIYFEAGSPSTVLSDQDLREGLKQALDQIGPITKSVSDCAFMMNAIAGYDERDSTSVPRDVPDYTAVLSNGLEAVTVGIPKEYFQTEGLAPSVAHSIREAIKTIEDRGATVIDVSLPHTRYAVAAYYIIAPAEASSNLARYDGVKYGMRDKDASSLIGMYGKTRSKGFGKEVQRRLLLPHPGRKTCGNEKDDITSIGQP